MRRNRIAGTDIDVKLKYWTDGRPEYDLRASSLEIFSNINLLQTTADFTENTQEIEELYTEMDKNWAVFCLIDRFGGKTDLLWRAGLVLERRMPEFGTYYQSLDERNESVLSLIESMLREVEDGVVEGGFQSAEFAEWWTHIVMEQDFYYDPNTNSASPVPVHVPGIGAADDEEESVSAKLQDSSTYFIYAMCTPSKLRESKAAQVKALNQSTTLAQMAECGTYMNKNIINNLLTAGIMQQTKGSTADKCVDELKKGAANPQQAAVGLFWFIILAIVVVCVACAISLGYAITDMVMTAKNQKLAAMLSKKQLEMSQPILMDFDGDGHYEGVYDPVTGELKSEKITLDQEQTLRQASDNAASQNKRNALLACGVLAVGAWYLMS